jgi:hypothetical protein
MIGALTRPAGRLVTVWTLAALCPLAAMAQTDHAGHVGAPQAEPAAPTRWQWTVDSNAFFGFNYQHRKFRDFNAWESQNWLMASGRRRSGPHGLTVSSMLSLEAFTLRDIGSPQVFQTGETFRTAPLIDYQHPHDLVMNLGADYTRAVGRVSVAGGVDVVGSPTIGPPAFMHRPSARENPQAPLAHHYMDSTHITPGVVRGGLAAGPWRAEASWFRGLEPDEDRLDVDLGALDSAATRLTWTHGSWSAQASAAFLTRPELTTPGDAKKLTASLSYAAGTGTRGVAWMAAFGQKREIHGNLEAYLVEAAARLNGTTTVYARAESVAKDILDAGFHPTSTFHRHRQSQVGALTVGYLRDLLRTRVGGVALGADATGYLVPANLEESYGSPVSFHVFVRFRAPTPNSLVPAHVH